MKTKQKRVTILALFGVKDTHDHKSILKKLSRGVDVNMVDSDGRTLLMEAVIKGDHRLIELLIENGADLNIRDLKDWTALHFAAQEYDIVSSRKLIESGSEINATDDYGNSVISRAVLSSRGRGEVIRALIENGANINLKNRSGISALDLARSISNYDVVQFMI